ncbi:MAG: hypothetical protein KKF43_19450 [Proteobacteria bacterium]|nr:hypothetical protein [Pseudomonadota bacterium]
MKKIVYLIFSVLISVGLSGCSSHGKELLLDSFEGDLNHETVDYGSGGGANLAVTAEKDLKFHGTQSIKLEYDMSEGGYLWAARGYNIDVKGAAKWEVPPEKIKWDKYNAFSVYMYGKNSKGKVAFDIKDSGFEIWRFMIDDDFEGWKEIVMPFSEFFARADWQPFNADRNSVRDFPIMTFQLEPRRPDKGVYLFDCVSLKKVKKTDEKVSSKE